MVAMIDCGYTSKYSSYKNSDGCHVRKNVSRGSVKEPERQLTSKGGRYIATLAHTED